MNINVTSYINLKLTQELKDYLQAEHDKLSNNLQRCAADLISERIRGLVDAFEKLEKHLEIEEDKEELIKDYVSSVREFLNNIDVKNGG